MGTRLLCAFCCALLLSNSTWGGVSFAATIEPVQGNLSVNQGQGFQPITSRVDVNVGDTLMVGPGGSATVTYDDGCTVKVQPGAVTTIAPLSPCASGSNAQNGPDDYWLPLGFSLLVVGIGTVIAVEGLKSPSNNGPNPTASVSP
jgi:hypothetical protein